MHLPPPKGTTARHHLRIVSPVYRRSAAPSRFYPGADTKPQGHAF